MPASIAERAARPLERAARCPAAFAGRGIDALPAPPRRGVESRHGEGRRRQPPRKAPRRPHRPRVVRRRGPHADDGGGRQGGAGERRPARGAAGRVLLLAGDAPARRVEPAAPRRPLPRRRCRRRHDGLQPHRGRRGPGRTRLRPPGGRRAPVARRRQHGPRAGEVRRGEVARRREARRGAIRPAHPGVPAGERGAARPESPGATDRHRRRPGPIGHRRHRPRPFDAGRRAPGDLRRLLPRREGRRDAGARRALRPARDGPALRQRPRHHAAPRRVPAGAAG